MYAFDLITSEAAEIFVSSGYTIDNDKGRIVAKRTPTAYIHNSVIRARLTRAVIDNHTRQTASKKVIAVFDSDKFKRSNFALISDISRLDTIITDSKIDPEIKTNIEKLGIDLLIAEVHPASSE